MGSPSNLNIAHYGDKHKQAGAILGRQGGWRKNDWKGKVIVVLIFGVPSNMTRIEFKKRRNEVGKLEGKVEGEGEHFRATLTPKVSKECWHGLED